MRAADVVTTATRNAFRSRLRTTLTALSLFVGAFTLTLTTGAHGFTVAGAQPGPCYVNASVADELVGAHFTRQEQP